ncbi:hypothetical protein [uncultured Paracoccus sp.]|uniref:hypothetical protein n=1 Tax=uncultured Paracoccus sp. TaxID=189685 RepID=UPI002633DA5F|nr:hypothetical protein [uncultured Paracoccus sp.]
MDKLVYGGIGAVLGAVAASALFLALPDTSPPLQDDGSVAMQPLTEEEQAEEDRFLDLNLGAEEAPAVEPLEDAQNVPYASCEKPPELVAWLGKPGNATFARRRDLHSYLTATNVLATRDCTCTGKVLPVSTLMAFETRMMEAAGVTDLEDLVTQNYYNEARVMRWQIEDLCGGPI